MECLLSLSLMNLHLLSARRYSFESVISGFWSISRLRSDQYHDFETLTSSIIPFFCQCSEWLFLRCKDVRAGHSCAARLSVLSGHFTQSILHAAIQERSGSSEVTQGLICQVFVSIFNDGGGQSVFPGFLWLILLDIRWPPSSVHPAVLLWGRERCERCILKLTSYSRFSPH